MMARNILSKSELMDTTNGRLNLAKPCHMTCHSRTLIEGITPRPRSRNWLSHHAGFRGPFGFSCFLKYPISLRPSTTTNPATRFSSLPSYSYPHKVQHKKMKRSSPTTPPPTTPDPDPSPPEPPTNTPKRLKPDPDTGSNTKTKTRTRIPSTPATPHSAVPGLSAENKMALIDELIGEGMKHVDLQTWADRVSCSSEPSVHL